MNRRYPDSTDRADGNIWFTERSGSRIDRIRLRRNPQPVAFR